MYTSQDYIQDNPRITIGRARHIMSEHDLGEDWITFAFTDHPEAITFENGQGYVDTAILLGWMGY